MITNKHIEIYRKYGGDGDGLIRCVTPEEKEIMDYNSWTLIESLLQDLFLIKKGVSSLSFTELTNQKLIDLCDNKDTIQALKEIS